MKKAAERVKSGSVSLPLWQHKEGWRWAWKDAEGKWRYGTRKSKPEAKAAALSQAIAISNGKLDLEAITASQADLVRQFLALSPTSEDLRMMLERRVVKTSVTVAQAVARWKAHKLAELGGTESRTLKGDSAWFLKLAGHFQADNASEIPTDRLQEFIESCGENPKSRKTYRARVCSLWKFSNAHEIFTSTAADRLPIYKAKTKAKIDILTPDQASILLREVGEDFRPWLVFGLFSGLRVEEITSRQESVKPSLRWEHVKAKVIDVPADVSKRRKRRIMPILPTLAAWLKVIKPPKAGRIIARSPSRHETGRLGELIGGWPRNVLRHSYGSYRCADTKDAPALSLEMGNSVAMIEAHYREAVTDAEAKAFWKLTPSEVFRKPKNDH